MTNLRAIVALGRIAHEQRSPRWAQNNRAAPFGHGGRNAIGDLALFDSYHCSRYNTNTGVLTPEMFRSVFADVRDYLARR